ncbi:MAG: ABC transporter ATP-binding protein [Candidatus Bathyarchaeota archaeon]
MEYAIETKGLFKRYPTSSRRQRGFFSSEHVNSFTSILRIFRANKGPFIEALRGVDLKIKQGEIFGVLGPNGAGKTTLIKILSTLVIHDEGEVYIHGFDVKKKPSEVLKILQAVLPESRGFAWRLTGRQNLEFYSLLYGLGETEAKERINFLLEFTGLKERADDGYQRYSTGMQRKLLLCRALLRNTPTLLFDEPTVGLDPNSAAEFRTLLQKKLAREEKKTILLSTHNLSEAQGICDRVAILDRGRITACDTPDNIRYMMFDEKVFTITFIDAIFNEKKEKMMNQIEAMTGVHGATPVVDLERNFKGLSIRVNKDMDLSSLLEVIMRSGAKIKVINTQEPTLEDAFKAITEQHPRQSGEFQGSRRGS